MNILPTETYQSLEYIRSNITINSNMSFNTLKTHEVSADIFRSINTITDSSSGFYLENGILQNIYPITTYDAINKNYADNFIIQSPGTSGQILVTSNNLISSYSTLLWNNDPLNPTLTVPIINTETLNVSNTLNINNVNIIGNPTINYNMILPTTLINDGYLSILDTSGQLGFIENGTPSLPLDSIQVNSVQKFIGFDSFKYNQLNTTMYSSNISVSSTIMSEVCNTELLKIGSVGISSNINLTLILPSSQGIVNSVISYASESGGESSLSFISPFTVTVPENGILIYNTEGPSLTTNSNLLYTTSGLLTDSITQIIAESSLIDYSLNGLGNPKDIIADDNYVYIVNNSNNTFMIISIANKSNPTIVSILNNIKSPVSLVMKNNKVYIIGIEALYIIDVSNVNLPIIINTYGLTNPKTIQFVEDILYIIAETGSGYLMSFNVSDPLNIVLLKRTVVGYNVTDSIILDNKCYVAGDNTPQLLQQIAYGFVNATINNEDIYTNGQKYSYDTVTWEYTNLSDMNLQSTNVAWSPTLSMFAGAGNIGGYFALVERPFITIYSYNGILWYTGLGVGNSAPSFGKTIWGLDKFCMITSNSNLIWISTDGINWSTNDYQFPNILQMLWTEELSIFSVVCENFVFGVSPDAISWTTNQNFIDDASVNIRSVLYTNNKFTGIYSTTTNTLACNSLDGLSWTTELTNYTWYESGGDFYNVIINMATYNSVYYLLSYVTYTTAVRIADIYISGDAVLWSPLNIYLDV